MHEPTVLDYIISKLIFGKKRRSAVIELPPLEEKAKHAEVVLPPAASPINKGQVTSPDEGEYLLYPQSVMDPTPGREESTPAGIPWLAFGALILALIAQMNLEPPHRSGTLALVFYLLSATLLIAGYFLREIRLAPLRPNLVSSERPFRLEFLLFGLALGLLAFLLFYQDVFTGINLVLWLVAIILTMMAFWSHPMAAFRRILAGIRRRSLTRLNWKKILFPALVVLLLGAVVIFFRFYRLEQLPPEMVSDHAEKLQDVMDVMLGQYPVYFARNTGREFFQFYWTALIIKLFGTGITFFSLKLGTALAGVITLPYIYLLGKEFASRQVGVIAVALTGMAYWANVISRLGLRFPFYPLFVAPALFYMLRGLRRQSRNDFVWAGLALGIGLHGYTSFRIVPVLVVIGFVLFILHRQTGQARRSALIGLGIISLVSLIVFIPLFRYAVNHPDMFVYRTLTRVGTIEQPLPGPAFDIFMQNLQNALTMLNFSDGEIWVHSVTFRPALDLVSAGLFIIGLILLIIRYSARRTWQDLFIILSIPILMMPSVISLAFPAENPSLNRTAGAIVPVFLVVALGLDALISSISVRLKGMTGKIICWIVAGILLIWSGVQNYDLVFNQYYQVYLRSTWNTSEMGNLIRQFAGSGGSLDKAWVVGYPYWVDTRVVGFNAGYPGHDYAIWPEQFHDTVSQPGPKLFIINPQDANAMTQLAELYPGGQFFKYKSEVDTKDFMIFKVP
jgi:4-amino-4-deoxy-L-arabinose transferase-like glycosyltransferase